MQIDISFDFAKVFNVDERLNVVKGQTFSIFTDSQTKINFFSNNDAVLALTESDESTDVEATGLGQSTLLIMDDKFSILKTLMITVVASIEPPASFLGVSSEVIEK